MGEENGLALMKFCPEPLAGHTSTRSLREKAWGLTGSGPPAGPRAVPSPAGRAPPPRLPSPTPEPERHRLHRPARRLRGGAHKGAKFPGPRRRHHRRGRRRRLGRPPPGAPGPAELGARSPPPGPRRGRRRRKEEAAAAAAAAAAAMKASAGLPAPRAPRHVLARGLPRPGGRARAAPPSPAEPRRPRRLPLRRARGHARGEFRGGGGDGAGSPRAGGGRARPGRRAFAPAVLPLPSGRSSRDPAALLRLAATALRRFCSPGGRGGRRGVGHADLPV
ncbi:hypothetical protein EI555_018361 [Monodon monoceros]|uniref:Uncharacterized protein n=1 Tax=Monodon monoceros TaxID=40151 RepID=A0A4U1F368_MONMO|nr:hypothetical protein EI555_018361 [Monodon monoceros]